MKKIKFKNSKELIGEIESLNREFGKISIKDRFINHNLKSYCRLVAKYPVVQEVVDYLKDYKKNIKILEIGPGSGELAIYLSAKGYDIAVLDPAEISLRIIEYAAKKFNLKINTFNCTAECLDKICEKYDLIIFSRSLHHCNDAHRALNNCFNALNTNGAVIAANEPILAFYKSKKWFYKKIASSPEEFGHYGGAEHIYRYNEYVAMLRESGFKVKTKLNIINVDYNLALWELDKKRKRYSALGHFVRKIWFKSVAFACKNDFIRNNIIPLFQKLSLINTTFIGYRKKHG